MRAIQVKVIEPKKYTRATLLEMSRISSFHQKSRTDLGALSLCILTSS